MSLRDTLVDELRDLYSAENQLVKALPKLAKASEDEELSTAFQEHLEETKGQVERLKQVFQQLGEKPTGKHCKGMEGLVDEGKEAIEEDEEAPLGDIMLIGAAFRVEHYEIAGYTAAIEIASALGENEVVDLLTETLEEEQAAGEKLTAKGRELIQQAAQESDASEEEEEQPVAKSASSRAKSKTSTSRGRSKAA